MAAGWLKAAAVAALVGLAICAAVWSVSSFTGGAENNHLPRDFPHAFLAPSDNGHLDRVMVLRGRTAPEGPHEMHEVAAWPAWRCDNPACPGRREDRSYVFAYGDPAQGASRICPVCAAAFARAEPEVKAKYDPTQISPYFTPEGQAILAEARAKF